MERSIRPTAGSLNSLLVLEVAVRHASLSRAAIELGLSQPAVSRHIATLEDRLRQPLFDRNNNRITPTANAIRLADAVALGLGHVDQAWSEVLAAPETDEVTLACTFGFADQWLMPRHSDLRASLGGTRVRVVTTDQLGDIDMSRLDAAVVWDPSRMPERPYFPLIPSETFPVCTPGFLADHPEAADGISALPPVSFLHFDTGSSGFLTWPGWFEQAGLPLPRFGKAPEFDAYPFLLQAVLDGEGIALGWLGLVDQLLENGRLVRAGPSVFSRETAYYVQHRPVLDETGALARLLAWFQGQAPHR
ncbi:LysR family transcriptional regulator [Leisingera aquaemixtae]|uniref:LysR substrate-binding domain-containing protein n=1 Tax=Leisingera aquaemixtae TaxID=1396826 RepID=UPI001C95942E|nr:LysR substrate-binding domain-containing protein [Leisingera aquaemixtae]MBY6069145.1 LysR family transcriptional regulator [Leisingera aquaemixtae]